MESKKDQQINPNGDDHRRGLRGAMIRFLMFFEPLSMRYPLLVNVVIHSAIFSMGLLLAFLVWFTGRPNDYTNWLSNQFLTMLPFFVVVKLFVFWRLDLLKLGWRYASIRDIVNIVIGALGFLAIAYFCVLVTFYVPRMLERVSIPVVGPYFELFPDGVLVLDFMATVFLACTARLGFRLYREELRPIAPEGATRVLIIGAGNAAETIIREMNRMPVERYRVIGMIDDDPAKRNLTIHAIPVMGTTEDIRTICADEEVEEIIIAMPSATQKQMRHVIELCTGTKLKFQSLPSLGDLIDGRITVSQIRPVDINDLLGREAVELDPDALARFLKGRRVLITGAGGSIGSEMCRQVCNFKPDTLILVEQAENPLFEIQNEIKRTFEDIPLVSCICDIYDRERVMEVWATHRPEVVIHAAAHKHVPLMEQNPCEAVKNNIMGSRNVADASNRYDVDQFVMISTDKAVNPSSVMGASKRIAEIYTQNLNNQAGCNTQFKAVRFGNVLGSAGSVVPIFRRQIAAGGPVRVTHPEMTRYFMTIPEAAQLVLQAAATGSGGQIYLLDMGEPVKIVDLARQMITLSGFRPDEDIDIVFSGVRPGEKLFEELRTEGEDIEPTVHPKIRIWKSRPNDWDEVLDVYSELKEIHEANDRDQIIATIQRLVPEYEPLNPPKKTPRTKAAEPTN